MAAISRQTETQHEHAVDDADGRTETVASGLMLAIWVTAIGLPWAGIIGLAILLTR